MAAKRKAKAEAPANGKPRTFMHEQREDDAAEAKLGTAAKEVKACHLLAKEAATRLGAARLATSTPGAIAHDLERVVELAEDVSKSAKNALALLVR